jgi:Tfp pilus assembly protein PilX
MKQQSGSFLLSAVILIIVVGFLVLVVARLSIVGSHSTVNVRKSAKSFYIAESGLERASFALLTTDFGQRVACSSLTGHASFTNIAFGAGTFSVTGTSVVVSPPATLSGSLSSSATIIPMSSITGYADQGRVFIDKEAIDYSDTSTVSATCGGSAPCLTGAVRGSGDTTAIAHASGVPVAQRQCHVVSTGGVPNLTSPEAKSQVSADFVQDGFGLLVGKQVSGELLGIWDGAQWERLGPSASLPNVDFTGVEFISVGDAWAVGDKNGGDATIIHWDGSNWTRVLPAASVANQNLHGLYCLNSNDCWAVGDKKTIIHWNGSTWTPSSIAGGVANNTIEAVTCVAANDCWAVGEPPKSSGAMILHWNGTQWSTSTVDSSVPNAELNGVACFATNDCWAVGQQSSGANIVHWNGTTWSRASLPGSIPNKELWSISCPAANDCWAAGEKQGTANILHWNGSAWSRISAGGVASEDLNDISCAAADDCWVTGNFKTVGHWNGTSWSSIAIGSAIPSTASLRGIMVLTDAAGTTNARLKNWHQE